MKKVLIIPFYSQQDKETGKFVTSKCCVTRINEFIADKLTEYGVKVEVLVPEHEQCQGEQSFTNKNVVKFYHAIPGVNLAQRLWFDPELIAALIDGKDLIITNNEIQTDSIRKVATSMGQNISIIQINHLMATGMNEWMQFRQTNSWRSADAVVLLSDLLKRKAMRMARVSLDEFYVWPSVFPEFTVDMNLDRDIDYLFVQRSSASNYTHHREFVEAVISLRITGWKKKVVMTDPTNYIRNNSREHRLVMEAQIELADAVTRGQYLHLLNRSKTAIAMMSDDLHGGVAIREAIYAGCVPLLLRTEAYTDLMKTIPYSGDYFIDNDSVDSVRRGLLLSDSMAIWTKPDKIKDLREMVQEQTFEVAWKNNISTTLIKLGVLEYQSK